MRDEQRDTAEDVERAPRSGPGTILMLLWHHLLSLCLSLSSSHVLVCPCTSLSHCQPGKAFFWQTPPPPPPRGHSYASAMDAVHGVTHGASAMNAVHGVAHGVTHGAMHEGEGWGEMDEAAPLFDYLYRTVVSQVGALQKITAVESGVDAEGGIEVEAETDVEVEVDMDMEVEVDVVGADANTHDPVIAAEVARYAGEHQERKRRVKV